jgi:hypothetical protein
MVRRNVVRRNVGALLGCIAAMAVAGCPKLPPAPPLPPDGGAPNDGPIVIDYTDTDADGLCDRTELSRGTDPTVTDTDGDGLTDRVEVDFGFQPTRTDSPDRELLVPLAEAPGREVRLPIPHIVNGEGGTYTGAFQPLPSPGDLDASTFYRASLAFGADPRGNVFEIEPEEQRISGVFDRTQLIYEVFFEVPLTLETRGCIHAYPWRYNIKRDDGTLVFARRYLLVVTPESVTDWCAPQGLCI